MAELDILSKSETPNLATLHRLAYAGEKVADHRNLLNYKILHRPNGEE